MKKFLSTLVILLTMGCNLDIGNYCYGPVGLFHGEKVMVDNSCGDISPDPGIMQELDIQHDSEYLVCGDYYMYEYPDWAFIGPDICNTRFRGILTTTEEGYILYERYFLDCSYIWCSAHYETKFF